MYVFVNFRKIFHNLVGMRFKILFLQALVLDITVWKAPERSKPPQLPSPFLPVKSISGHLLNLYYSVAVSFVPNTCDFCHDVGDYRDIVIFYLPFIFQSKVKANY